MKKSMICLFTLCSVSLVFGDNINWQYPPTTLSSMTNNASNPQIVMDPSGNVAAAWVENGYVMASTKLHNMAWSAPQTLSSSMGSAPSLVVNQLGDVTVVWIDNGVVNAATKLLNQAWEGATPLSNTGASQPDVAINTTGDMVAVWIRNNNVETSTKIMGGAWQNMIAINGNVATSPRVAMGGSGTSAKAIVVWNDVSGGIPIVYASSKSVPGKWIARKIISDATTNAMNPNVAVDSNGNGTVVWYRFDVANSIYSNVVLQAATRTVAGVWSLPENISTAGIRNPADLAAYVGYDANGNALALWTTSFDGDTFDIQSATKPALRGWNSPVEIVHNVYSLAADLSVNSLGDALALYMFYNGAALQIQSSETNLSGFARRLWTTPLRISEGSQNAFPHAASVLNGNHLDTAAIWLHSNGTTNTVQATTGSRSVVQPPTNVSVTQQTENFGVFTSYTNELTWCPSPDSHVIGYAIFRNGGLVDIVYGSHASQFKDTNQVQNGSVVYGVAAIDDERSQSPIVNVSFP